MVLNIGSTLGKMKSTFDMTRRRDMGLRIVSVAVWLALMITYFFSLSSSFAVTIDNSNYLSANAPTLEPLDCVGAVLMEAKSGTVLYEQNADQPLPPASVTKIMTLLIVMEALEKGTLTLDQMLTASDNAASMGGSQIFLEPGETMSVDDLIKSVVISSANDAAVVLAEAIAGSEESFVVMMNERAAELGMKNTHFENTNGLDDTVSNHVISARDVAIMSRALIEHEKILKYSCIWMDTVRNGEFGLTNTNRLIRFYNGATGLKTGSTSKAKFCISATAERDGMHLIAVIMGSPARDTRNAAATKLLDWGFANFSLFTYKHEAETALQIKGALADRINIECGEYAAVVPKGEASKVQIELEIPDYIIAPINKDDVVGKIKFLLDGELIGDTNITTAESCERIKFSEMLSELIKKFFLC